MTLSFIYGFDWYLVKSTFISKPTCRVILPWPWLLYGLDRQGHFFQFCFNCHNFFYLFMDFIHTWTKQHLWPNRHVEWIWYDFNLYMTLTKKVRFLKLALIIITLIWSWPLYDFDPQDETSQFCFNYQLFPLLI